MTCRFLENLTLRSLIAPVAEEEFRARYWTQKPLVVHRKDPDYYGDLFTLQDFDEAIAGADHVQTSNTANRKNETYKGATVPGSEAVLADMREGGTLVLIQYHRQEPKLRQLCRLLGAEFGHKFHANMYLTPPHGKGFTPHFDFSEMFILQVFGSKRWKIEKQRRSFRSKEEERHDDDLEFRGAPYSFTLEQGDLIYIPRGFVHSAECGSEPSMHITLEVMATLMEALVHRTITAAVDRDERLRAPLSPGFMHGGRESLVKDVMSVLRDTIDETFISTVVDQFMDELVRKFPLDTSGQVVDFFQPTPFTAGDVVGPRRGIVHRMHAGDDSVRLNIGTRSIVFPGFFREALDFALNTPAFAIRELPGELEDEERIAFAERLVQEGLIIRK